jgi:hypothetical protein
MHKLLTAYREAVDVPTIASRSTPLKHGIINGEATTKTERSLSPEKPNEDNDGGPKEGSNRKRPMPRHRHRSSIYRLAAARDGINEMHPEILEKRIQVRCTLAAIVLHLVFVARADYETSPPSAT